MTADTNNKRKNEGSPLWFNGVDATTGSYLFPPLSVSTLSDVALGRTLDRENNETEHLAELQMRVSQRGEAHYGVAEGIDPTKLEQAGWGAIFPFVAEGSDAAREQDAIREALAPLLQLRKAQATKHKEHYYREYRGELGYRPGESKQAFLARLGAGPGPADPEIVPYYLLIVGSPQVIPYHVQYQIDVQYAVGRIHFDTLEEYASYAASVVASETSPAKRSREIALVGVEHLNDPATHQSRTQLIDKLALSAEGWSEIPGLKVTRYVDDDAQKATVSRLFGGDRTPALIFTASHGLGFPKGDPRQVARQGALVLQDWEGFGTGLITEDLYLCAEDIPSDAALQGLIVFNFACYGAGTPEYDEFTKRARKERKVIAEHAFVSGLHKKLLGHPKGGALATIGHVERAWDLSFLWETGEMGAAKAQIAVFESTLKALMRGKPVGLAVDYLNERYAELASDLSRLIEELDFNPSAADAETLAGLWIASNDARNYAVVGDPAVRLPFDDGEL